MSMASWKQTARNRKPKGKRVPIRIRIGKNSYVTLYIRRKWVLAFAGAGLAVFVAVGLWLYWLWYYRIPEITGH
jgi:hypothetical protein